MALRVVFGQIDAVVQPARGLYDLYIGVWVITQQRLRGGSDAGQVSGVVGRVVIDEGQNNAVAGMDGGTG